MNQRVTQRVMICRGEYIIMCDSYICKDDSGNDYLLGWNKWRNRYEVFGGCIEKGESAEECISRECFEELGIQDADIHYLGAIKLLLKPDYFSSDERIEYGGLYGATIDDIGLDEIYKKINDKEEITNIALYSQVKNKESIAVIDEKLLEYFI